MGYYVCMKKTLPFLFVLTYFLAGCQESASKTLPNTSLDGIAIAYIDKRDTRVGIYKVDDIVTNESDIHTFVTQIVAPSMRASTQKMDAEICGSICMAPDGALGITLTTVGSKASCPVTNACPKGMIVTDNHIHTHVDTHSYYPSSVDKNFLKGEYEEDKKVFTHSEQFSDQDLGHPFGFLITPQRILYQEGQNSVFVVQE